MMLTSPFMDTKYKDVINKDPQIIVNHSTLQVTLRSTTVPQQYILRHLQNKLLRSVNLFITTIIYQN